MSKKAEISKQGKNRYICIEGCIITVNASSYTIITAHKESNGFDKFKHSYTLYRVCILRGRMP